MGMEVMRAVGLESEEATGLAVAERATVNWRSRRWSIYTGSR